MCVCLAEVQRETGNQARGWGLSGGKRWNRLKPDTFQLGSHSSLSVSGNPGLGLWRVYLGVSPDWPPAGRSAGCLAGSLAPAPPGRSIACQPSMWQSPSTKAAAGRLVLEDPSVPWTGGCSAQQPLSALGPQALNPLQAGFLGGCQGRERSPRLDPCWYSQC